MNDEIKLCINCKHCINKVGCIIRCSLYPKIDIVTGRTQYEWCSTCRGYGKCEVDGKYFKAKKPSIFNKLILKLEGLIKQMTTLLSWDDTE